ncbi:MAG: helix-turn-helix domain-containing protein [Burkholderiaceae bacterium]|jgi:hypothetical protein|nr:helix-turn-helix domain-containing protein [Burkholderiaceae bacterium]
MNTTSVDPPIFQCIESALFFSYIMEGAPVLQQSPTGIVLERLRQLAGLAPAYTEPGTIRFGQLTPLEKRAQCAIVRAAVEHHLTAPEAGAVKARYGRNGQPCKAQGIEGVRNYCMPLLSIQGDDPTLAMAWGVFGEKKQREFLSQRTIANEFGLSQSTVCRDMKRIRFTGRALLNRAIKRLQPMFEQQGLVGDKTD